uniref:Uncharacterized protein n=1 Tax=Cucumis melo TaxID=3656 RepID=A0A9I9EG84_CUCME
MEGNQDMGWGFSKRKIRCLFHQQYHKKLSFNSVCLSDRLEHGPLNVFSHPYAKQTTQRKATSTLILTSSFTKLNPNPNPTPIVSFIIAHTITSLLPELLPHRIRIKDKVVLTFEELTLPLRHTKNPHSIKANNILFANFDFS